MPARSSSAEIAYRAAQRAAERGDHRRSLELIDLAEREFAELGDELSAARCDAGRSLVLQDLGDFSGATAAARRWLTRVEAGLVDDRSVQAQAHSNLAACLYSAGEYLAAEAAFARGTQLARQADDSELAATLQVNHAAVLNALGRGPDAYQVLLEALDNLSEASGEPYRAALVNVGETLCSMGHPDEGLTWFSRVEGLVAEASVEHAGVLLETAAALDALGASDEAIRRYRECLDIVEAFPAATIEARAWRGYGTSLRRVGSQHLAAEAFTNASRRFLAAGSVPEYALCEAEALSLTGTASADVRRAARDLLRVVDSTDEAAWPIHACEVRLILADVLGFVTAETQLRQALRLAESAGVPHLVGRACQKLAVMELARGCEADALAFAERAIEVASVVQHRLLHDRVAVAFADNVADAWSIVVRIRLRRCEYESALEAVESSRSASLGIVERNRSERANEASLRDAGRDELSALYRRLCVHDPTMQRSVRLGLEQRARELEQRLDRLDLADSRPNASSSEPAPPPADGEAAIVFVVYDHVIGALVRTRDSVQYFSDLATMADVRRHMGAFHAAGRRALAMARVRGDSFDESFVDSARSRMVVLGRLLMREVVDSLPTEIRKLVIVPHGGLRAVPFGALESEGQALIERFEIDVVPSLRVRANRPPSPGVRRTVVIGFHDGDLPEIDDEIADVVRAAPAAEVLMAATATSDRVSSALEGASHVHIASHGIFRAASPRQSGIQTADGWLTVDQISKLDMAGATVILSACDTGCATTTTGDEIIGLQRGFLQAGARSLVMAAWPTIDEVSRRVCADTHLEIQNGAEPSAALRRAVLAERVRSNHPWWWAPFFVCSA